MEVKGKLTKRVPARKVSLEILQCRKDMFIYDESFRSIRSGARNKFDKCYWCKRPFEDGESFALAIVKGSINKSLCNNCADEALEAKTK